MNTLNARETGTAITGTNIQAERRQARRLEWAVPGRELTRSRPVSCRAAEPLQETLDQVFLYLQFRSIEKYWVSQASARSPELR